MKRKKPKTNAPPIFADLVLEMPDGECFRVDVEQPGWLKGLPLDKARRVGLVHRKDDRIRVWVSVNGERPEYLSRVLGRIEMSGGDHGRVRVAGLLCGETGAWLHEDGLVEVGPEPTIRGLG
jgi:hypothetical protein